MKIVVLDGFTLNPGDLTWDAFQTLGDFTVYDRTNPDQVLERAGSAEIILTNKTVLNMELLQKIPALKYIGLLSTGANVIDIDTADKQGITISNVPAYSTPSVAQLTFSLILELCNQVGLHSREVLKGKWANSQDFCFWDAPLTELKDKTIGLIGFGDIGQQVAAIAKVFGMNVMFYSRTKKDSLDETYRQVGLEELLSISDVMSLHCPLTPQTKEIINRESLQKMKRTAYLINTARGPLIQEQDLDDALNEGIIAGAGLDVLSTEPPAKDNPLLSAKNCIITPHIAWATKEARERLMKIAFKNLQAFLSGSPINIITNLKK